MPEVLQTELAPRVQFLNTQKLPAVISALPGESLQTLLSAGKTSLTAIQRRHGAILFRGFPLATAEDFRAAADLWFKSGLRSYIGGVSPRGQVTAGVYESTRFPAHMRIPQHNEMAYLPEPPRELAFFCEIEPGLGGETPLADCRTIFASLDPGLRAVFEARGISYHRYLYGPKWNLHHLYRNKLVKLHTSWMAAFATTHPAVVESFCKQSGSTLTWDREQGARISNLLPAVRPHPETGEMLWFNQISSFTSSPRATGFIRWLLYQVAYPNPFRRPLHATFGDGRPISLAQLNQVNSTVESATIRFPWQRGDLLFVDNFLVSHGRMPFSGNRRILVAIH